MIVILLIALWLGVPVPAPLKDTKVDHAAQALKDKMDHYLPTPHKAPGA